MKLLTVCVLHIETHTRNSLGLSVTAVVICNSVTRLKEENQ